MNRNDNLRQTESPDSTHGGVLLIFGTRPEAIKMAPVLAALLSRGITASVCVTGQHREMIDPVLSFFDIQPEHRLSVMRPNQGLSQLTASILVGVSDVLERVRPDLVLVHGDTTTTMGASLAAYYHKIPVGHVEAGLRTGLKHSPFPEEINRKVTGSLADFHFAPTERAKENLIHEGVPRETVWVTGNTAIDALLFTHRAVMSENEKYRHLLKNAGGPNGNSRRKVLITAHRRESFGAGFEQICNAILQLAREHRGVDFIYPVHMNPNVRGPVESILAPAAKAERDNLFLIEPLDYPTFVYLMSTSELILSDSGGIQEEAPSLGKIVVVMRESTERPEGVNAGTSLLVGANQSKIVEAVTAELDRPSRTASLLNPYGDGHAAERIADAIVHAFAGKAVAQ